MFLTQDEIKELTGYKKYACQIRWLRHNGFKYVVGYDGKPKVTQDHINLMLGSVTHSVRKKTQPDFSMFERAI